MSFLCAGEQGLLFIHCMRSSWTLLEPGPWLQHRTQQHDPLYGTSRVPEGQYCKQALGGVAMVDRTWFRYTTAGARRLRPEGPPLGRRGYVMGVQRRSLQGP